jgi:hypothetical protein
MVAAVLLELGSAAHDGEPPLAHPDTLAPDSEAPVVRQPGEAQLTERPTAVELVKVLPWQRRAAALAAGCGAWWERSDAAPHEQRGQFGHGNSFETGGKSPSS